MLFGHVLANFINDMLNAAFETGRNGLARTLMIEQVPAENSTGKRGRSLGCFFHGNPLDVREFFGLIVLMAVPIMKTEPLKLDVIRRGHNSDTALALASMAHWTTIHHKYDTARVGMIAGELPAS